MSEKTNKYKISQQLELVSLPVCIHIWLGHIVQSEGNTNLAQ